MRKIFKILWKSVIAISATILLLCCSVWIFRDRITLWLFSDNGLATAERFVNDSLRREVIIIPMAHLNTLKYYDRLRRYLSDMKQQGYVTFNECVMTTDRCSDTTQYLNYADAVTLYSLGNATDSLKVCKLRLKQRRIIGYAPMLGNDSLRRNNKSIGRALRDSKYFGQTAEKIGINTSADYWVDLTLADLVARFEADNGEIVLTDYDYDTPLLSEYRNACADRREKDLYMRSYRDRQIMRMVIEAPFPKIITLYGSIHQHGISYILQQNGFVRDYGYRVPEIGDNP